jgi:ornithine carbamoyltransferase
VPLPTAAAAAFDVCEDLRGRDFLTIQDLRASELRALLESAAVIKADPARFARALRGKSLALIFEKPSLRTRVSFDVAMFELGGHAVALQQQEVGLRDRESLADIARTLDGMVAVVVARTFAHDTLQRLARAATVPVVNGLSDLEHPCQTLADLLTMREVTGRLDGLRVAYVGDGNNVAHSLICAAALLGIAVSVASPLRYQPRGDVVAWAREHAADPDAGCRVTTSPAEAVYCADVVYTDTWISMGQEADAPERREAFAGYEVTPALLRLASPHAVFMHCLPAHRGEEVAAEVIDSPQSVVFRQAANRLPTEKALLRALIG